MRSTLRAVPANWTCPLFPSNIVQGHLADMQQNEIDLWHIRRALELARRGQGFVEPNPMVGCVIAQGAEIIGEGWHRRFGQAHAEVEALQMAGDRAAGGTLYVTLEPCCHHGKTPPCTEAVLASGVRRVVVAMRDPFPQVQGGGIAALRAAGIAVDVGLLEAEAARLNAPVPETRRNRQAVDHRQMGHDARRQDRHPHRREPLDIESAIAGNRSRAARPG